MNEHGHPGYDRPVGDAPWIHDGPPVVEPTTAELDAAHAPLCAVCWWLHVESFERAAKRTATMTVGGHSVCREHVADAFLGGSLADVLRRAKRPVPPRRAPDLPPDGGCDYA
jgi:hypothetical protein